MPLKAESFKDKEILSLNNSAKFIGINKQTLSAKLKSGEIAGRFIGNSWHVYKQDLIDWVRSGNKPY
jgi:hypothetical protein